MLADPKTKEAVIIDPVYEKAERDVELVKQLGLNLKYAGKDPKTPILIKTHPFNNKSNYLKLS